MMSYKLFLVAALGCGGIVHAMENAENSLQSIQTWQDIEPFTCKVVAYTAKTPLFNGNSFRCILPSSDLNYAYIDKSSPSAWEDLGMQYTVHQLLKRKSMPKHLGQNTLARESLKMRDITTQEAKEIMHMLDSKKGSFFLVWNDQKEKLMSHLKLIAEQ
jgi:hypothetical protein